MGSHRRPRMLTLPRYHLSAARPQAAAPAVRNSLLAPVGVTLVLLLTVQQALRRVEVVR